MKDQKLAPEVALNDFLSGRFDGRINKSNQRDRGAQSFIEYSSAPFCGKNKTKATNRQKPRRK
jgi:hypothetical protein|tara:strand:- start:622 stop:810 length:189 start_codon:yes stop_codon:yes gene_type:complete